MELRFRPTVWPGQPVPVPRIPAVDKVSHEDGWLVLDRPSGSYVDVPPEVYLREFRDTNPADIDQLARLCSLGLICPLTDPPFLHDLEWGTTGPVPRLWSSWLGALAVQLDLPRETGGEAELKKGWRRSAGKAVHVTEVAVRVWFVQRCTEHLLAYAAGEPVRPVWRDAVVYAGSEPVRQPWRDAEDEAMAWRNFTEITDAALRDFHVRVSVATGDGQPTIGGAHTTLYSAAMLQLVNDLAEEVPYLRCANETCGRLFARQRGRTEHGGNRMRGVIYCSNTCARAQYQREKRRRDRAAQKVARR